MSDSELENDVITGMLAVHAGLINEEQLVSCFRQWVNGRRQPLQDFLKQHGNLTDDEFSKLDRLVAEHLSKRNPEPLAELQSIHPLTISLQDCIDDPQLRACLQNLQTRNATPADEPPQDSTDRLGHQWIGTYKLLSLLGEGGMGTVFVAEQQSPVRRRVALKVIKKGMDSAQVLARFEAERQALAMMDHRSIARVFETGETDDGRPYFAMELVKGISITEYCDANRLPLIDRLNLFVEVCNAVQHAHQKGIIHRDIKPSNILVKLSEGVPVPKIIDFGLAKALEQNLANRTVFTQLGQVVGTLEYMSPEQAQMTALDIDTRTDIYSLGVVLYELLTGSTPLQRKTIREQPLDQVLARIRNSEPVRPSSRLSESGDAISQISECRSTIPHRLNQSVRGDLDWIVMKALEKDRTRRYETATGLANDVKRHLNDEPVMATPPSAAYRFRKFARRNKKLLAGGTVAVLLLTTATIVSTFFAGWALNERREAQLSADQAQVSAGKFKAINDFIIDDLLAAARPEGTGLGVDVTLKEALDHAAESITAAFQDQPEIEAEVRTTLGKSYRELGEYDDAAIHLIEALRLRRVLYGEENKETLQSLTHYAQLLYSKRKLAQAEDCYRQLYQGLAKVYGSQHRLTLDAQRVLAGLLSVQGKAAEALPILRETIDLCQQALSENDEITLNTRNELAYTLRDLGEFDESEELFRINLAKRREVHGDRHPETLIAINNLAGVLDETNQLEEAEALFVECLGLRKQVLGHDHPGTITVMNNLGVLYNRKGELSKAESLMREVIELQKQLRGAEHRYTLKSTVTLAMILRKQEKLSEAESISRENLSIQQRVLGPRHRDVLVNMQNLAEILRGQSRLDESEQMHRDVLFIRREDNIRWQDVADSLLGLGRTLLENSNPSDAEPLLRESIELYRADFPHVPPSFTETAVTLGDCLTHLKKFEDAEAILLECHGLIQGNESLSAYPKNAVVDQLIALYESWNKPKQVEQWAVQRIDE